MVHTDGRGVRVSTLAVAQPLTDDEDEAVAEALCTGAVAVHALLEECIDVLVVEALTDRSGVTVGECDARMVAVSCALSDADAVALPHALRLRAADSVPVTVGDTGADAVSGGRGLLVTAAEALTEADDVAETVAEKAPVAVADDVGVDVTRTVADELAQLLGAMVRDGVGEPEPLAVVDAVPLAVNVGVVVPLALRVTLTVLLSVDVELPAGVDDELTEEVTVALPD